MIKKTADLQFFLSRGLATVVAATMIMLATAYYVEAFDSGFTNRAVADGNARLEACRSVQKPKRFDCVSDALNSVASKISRKPDYRPAARIFRNAAAKVKSSKVYRKASAALNAAKKSLLRATGQARPHYKKLAQLMDKAKSVLRS